MSSPRPVASLLGSAQVPVALPCLGSLVAASADPLALRLHDDGTLTPADRERLAAALGEPAYLARREADERVEELLARYPHCRRFRAGNPLGLKLFDTVLLAPSDEVAFVDSDVLFLRPFSGLFTRPLGVDALFMQDRQNAYTVRSWHRLREPRLRLPCRLNSGILAFDRRAFDLDLLEWFFARPAWQRPVVWAEQTAWALLAGRVETSLYDGAQCVIPAPPAPLPAGAVAVHFVSPVRHLLWPVLEGREPKGGEPVTLRHLPARPCGVARLFAGELARRLRR